MSEHPAKSLTDTTSQAFRLPPQPDAGFCVARISPAGSFFDNLITLGTDVVTLGRDPDCEIPVMDEFSSRRHATFEFEDGQYWLTDCGSRNGTFVNDERVQSHALEVGDQIRVGGHVFKFLNLDHPESRYFQQMHEAMASDALTSIANRRYFEETFQREISRCSRHRRPLGVLVLDIDQFKQVNDTQGHFIGDECLKELCKRVRSAIREDDLFARIGGDEFAIVLPELPAADCRRVAERIRTDVDSVPFGRNHGLSLRTSVSIGIAHTNGRTRPTTQELLIDADARLYAAKEGGRNCICGPGVPIEVTPMTREMPAMKFPTA